MADHSAIEWTEATWNPVVGCTHVSAGCDNCYAARETSGRLRHLPLYAGLARGGKFTGEVRLVPERLDQPLRWRRPRRVFVNSMSDLFHDDVPDEFIARVYAVMAAAPQHAFQVLTKRHARMRSLLSRPEFKAEVALAGIQLVDTVLGGPWPLPNVWLGVSVENQQWADIRVPALLSTPAAVRWLSCEPLLGSINLRNCGGLDAIDYLDWIVVGGESGPKARPMHPGWARSLRNQCVEADVPFFLKQWGEWLPHCEVYSDDDDHFDEVSDLIFEDHWVAIEPSGYVADSSQQPGHQPVAGSWYLVRTGKKAAGRELDGRTWDEYPRAAEAVAS